MTESPAARSRLLRPALVAQERSRPAQPEPDLKVGPFAFADEAEAAEAVENFRHFLAILREWDERENGGTEGRA